MPPSVNKAPSFFIPGGTVTTDVNSADFDVGQTVYEVADGKIVVTGYDSNSYFAARYNADGSLDTTFGGGDGIAELTRPTDVNIMAALVVDSTTGVIWAAGSSFNGSHTDFVLMKYTSDGVIDTSFGGGDGLVSTNFYTWYDYGLAIDLDASGNIILSIHD